MTICKEINIKFKKYACKNNKKYKTLVYIRYILVNSNEKLKLN